jgi:membrane-bound serine protease (ClpP class)
MNLMLTALAFVVGSVFLFREGPWYRPAVNPVLAIVVSLLGGGFFYMSASKTIEARSRTPAHDLGSLIGAVGEARTDVHVEGSIYVHGEMWTAYSDKKIKAGSQVKVLEREGLMLKVEQIKES